MPEGQQIIPNDFKINERFKENLENIGFKVFLFDFDYKIKLGLKDKFIHGFLKFFKNILI